MLSAFLLVESVIEPLTSPRDVLYKQHLEKVCIVANLCHYRRIMKFLLEAAIPPKYHRAIFFVDSSVDILGSFGWKYT